MSFQALCELLESRIGLDARSLGESALRQSFGEAQKRAGASSFEDYYRVVKGSAVAYDALMEAVSVPESWFFRDELQLDYFVQHALRRREKMGGAKLQILSLPCARGEEPYSLAISLFDVGFKPEEFSITAIDLNERFIARAKIGAFPNWSLRGKAVSEAYADVNADGLQILPHVQAQVRFRSGNVMDAHLLNQDPFFDVVFCRNLLIYLSDAAKSLWLNSLKQRLTPAGLLVTGHAENVSMIDTQFVPAKEGASNCFVLSTREQATRSVVPPQPFAFQPISSKKSAQPELAISSFQRGTELSKGLPQRFALVETERAVKTVLASAEKTSENNASNSPITPKPSADDLTLEQVQAIADSGAIAEAKSQLKRYFSRTPREQVSAKAIYLEAVLAMASLDRRGAIVSLRQVLYQEREHVEALSLLAILLDGEGDNQGAQRLRERLKRVGTALPVAGARNDN